MSGMHGVVLAVLAVTVAVAGLPIVLDAGIDASSRQYNVDGETFTPTGGEVESFDDSHISRAEYDESVTVRYDNGTEASDSEYTWHTTNGTLTVTSGSELAQESNASIDYGWTGETKHQAEATNVLLDTVPWLKPLILIAVVALFLIVLRAMGGL